ncbi:NEDD8 ultimate buster 1 [Galemys pyrenaicus]|uniref:NEDD8 ultimate buster 1 n=1 Tax=Galemys pyrenaicus TaxID=202257 RepID=A0A8J5ZHY8_GALPY|nr:NEDD8 ultimate buster 1 [Galemys pyrenaicus]
MRRGRGLGRGCGRGRPHPERKQTAAAASGHSAGAAGEAVAQVAQVTGRPASPARPAPPPRVCVGQPGGCGGGAPCGRPGPGGCRASDAPAVRGALGLRGAWVGPGQGGGRGQRGAGVLRKTECRGGHAAMAQKKYLQSKLTQFLREDRIQLWKPPYTDENKEVGLALKDLAKKYSDRLECCENEVEKVIEEIRCKAIERGTGNEHFRATGIATIEVFLPLRLKKDRKNLLETRLNITGSELRAKIAETFGFQENYIRIVINKKQLQLEETLEEQGVTHNVKAMVLELKHSEEDLRKSSQMEEEEKNEAELREKRIQRTKRGLEILAERDEMAVDPETTPYLDIANQTGRSIRIPPSERRALMLAMGYHEKGRAFLKRQEYGIALPCLLDADKYFCGCCRELLDTVDNYAVLQLDIVWCYFRLGQLDCLDDAEKKLDLAQKCFKNCYGENHQRLVHIKVCYRGRVSPSPSLELECGNCGKEKVLFLRLYLLQGIRNYHSGNGEEACEYLNKAWQLFRELYIDPSKVHNLLQLGFTPQEARLGLRACEGNVDHAAAHITSRREELAQIRREEKEKKRRRLENINSLRGMGYSSRAAREALRLTSGNLDEALKVLLSNPRWWLSDSGPGNSRHQEGASQENIDQLVYMGFDPEAAAAALRTFRGSVQLAAQTLALNGGALPPDLQLSPEDSSSSSTPSTSPSDSAGTSSASTDEDTETEAVNEILEDIPEHEEDYLDSTLEDEEMIIAEYLSYVESIKSAAKRN